MITIHRKIEYALMALKYLSQLPPGEKACAKDICIHYHLPFDPTSRVLQILSKNRVLKSEHGTQGGYQIIKDLHSITFLDLSEYLLGRTAVAKCLNGRKCDLSKSCSIFIPVNKLNQHILSLFRSLNVAELLELNTNKISNSLEGIHG